MKELIINGTRPLFGRVRVHGAKNSVLPILAATVLAEGKSEILDCPDLRDVDCTVRILRWLGCEVDRCRDHVTVGTTAIKNHNITDALMREMRSSFIFLGAVLARTGRAVMSHPGGCELGSRPIDLHMLALRELGAEIIESGGVIECRADRLIGADIALSFPSVGATENIMLAATAAEGMTRIHNAAREPEIVDLQNLLVAMGAKVSGAGGSVIEIEGGRKLVGTTYRIIPDRIVTATYLAAVAAAGGEVTVENVKTEQVRAVSTVLREAGCTISENDESIIIKSTGALNSVSPIRTHPYPGFPTDAQSIIMSVMAASKGTTVFVENIFENRYRHVGELQRMGADIRVEGKVAVVCGVPRLSGANVSATDLRGGAGLIVAALGAEGTTRINHLHHIERGYATIEQDLRALGADIMRR